MAGFYEGLSTSSSSVYPPSTLDPLQFCFVLLCSVPFCSTPILLRSAPVFCSSILFQYSARVQVRVQARAALNLLAEPELTVHVPRDYARHTTWQRVAHVLQSSFDERVYISPTGW